MCLRTRRRGGVRVICEGVVLAGGAAFGPPWESACRATTLTSDDMIVQLCRASEWAAQRRLGEPLVTSQIYPDTQLAPTIVTRRTLRMHARLDAGCSAASASMVLDARPASWYAISSSMLETCSVLDSSFALLPNPEDGLVAVEDHLPGDGVRQSHCPRSWRWLSRPAMVQRQRVVGSLVCCGARASRALHLSV